MFLSKILLRMLNNEIGLLLSGDFALRTLEMGTTCDTFQSDETLPSTRTDGIAMLQIVQYLQQFSSAFA